MTMTNANDRVDEARNDNITDGYLIGVVIENNDLDGLGRIKCRVPDLYDPDQGDVPWIAPHKNSPFGVGKGYGCYGSPAIGSKVRVKLQNDDPHYGFFEADHYSIDNANAKFKNPQTWGFRDPSGNELFVNMATGDWQFTHSSGFTLFYDKSGDKTESIPGNETTSIKGSMSTQVTGSAILSSKGVLTLSGSTVNINGVLVINGEPYLAHQHTGVTSGSDLSGGVS